MTIKNYAVINNLTNICENVILWDGRNEPIIISEPETTIDEHGNVVETGNSIVIQSIAPWQPPANCYVVCIEGEQCGIDWKYDNGTWIDVRVESQPENPSSSEN
jgi:hypothetical protein